MGVRILLVEDEETLRRVIGRVLSGAGYEVVEAPNAEKALELFLAEPFPLIITDIVMGKMSGLELVEKIALIHPDTLAIIMTSHASVQAATTALRAGAYDFLIKPFDDLDVITAVVGRATETIRLRLENRALVKRLSASADELETLNHELKLLAVRDGLTGLYNHRYFRETLDSEIARSERFARCFSLCFCDIDYFKIYNDTHGHVLGDEVLKGVARTIRMTARRTSVTARYGGEEFVMLLPETDKQGAVAYAEGLRAAIAEQPFVGRESQPGGVVTISIGIATYPEDGRTATEVISCADQAMYAVKQGGRNAVVCASLEEV